MDMSAFEVKKIGSIIINDDPNSHEMLVSDNIILLSIDAITTFGQVMKTEIIDSVPYLNLEATKFSSKYGSCRRDEPTVISLTDFANHDVFMAVYIDNKVKICLIKK